MWRFRAEIVQNCRELFSTSIIEALNFLGPDEDPYLRGSLMNYSKQGFRICQYQDRFHHLDIFLMSDTEWHDRFLGDFQMHGQALKIDSRTTPEQMKEHFWNWSNIFDCDEETGEVYELVFRKDNRIIETMWEEDGQLFVLDMSLAE